MHASAFIGLLVCVCVLVGLWSHFELHFFPTMDILGSQTSVLDATCLNFSSSSAETTHTVGQVKELAYVKYMYM